MNISILKIISEKGLKSKEKVKLLGESILSENITIPELVVVYDESKGSAKGNCIEAIEYATKQRPELMDKKTFRYITQCLEEEEPRLKWESAKIMSNCAHLFKNELEEVIDNLLKNANHESTVVRWSVASAFAAIITLEIKAKSELIRKMDKIVKGEEKDSIKKIYLAALKKARKV